jgi:hypothetical protein
MALTASQPASGPPPKADDPVRSSSVRTAQTRNQIRNQIRKLVVIPVRFEGELPEYRHEQFEHSIRSALARGGVETVAAPPTGVDPETVGAAYALRSSVVIRRRDFDIKLEVVELATSRVVASNRETCNVCGAAEAAEVVTAQVGALVQKLGAVLQGPPVLVLTSEPPRMLVEIDGETVGRTPLRRVVTAGPHQIRMFGAGYVAEVREVESVNGVEESLALRLSPVPRRSNARSLRVAGGTLVGIGLGMVVVGAVLTAIDGQPYRARCSGTDVDRDGDCRHLYNGLPVGVSLTVTGATATLVGTGLLLAARRKSAESDPPRARVRLGWSAGGIMLSGRF